MTLSIAFEHMQTISGGLDLHVTSPTFLLFLYSVEFSPLYIMPFIYVKVYSHKQIAKLLALLSQDISQP